MGANPTQNPAPAPSLSPVPTVPVVVPSPPSPTASLDSACEALKAYRNRPLLVLYYPGRGHMTEDDLEDIYDAFRSAQVDPDTRLQSLDVLVDSNGGNPVAEYRIAQLIRDFAENVSVLVADHAYSAATLLCFAGDEVRLAKYAGVSPIDITLVYDSGMKPAEQYELANIENFLEFATNARSRIEQLLQSLGCDHSNSDVDSKLLVAMVNQVGAMRLGKFYRERSLTGHYAEELLDSYMFRDDPNKVERIRYVVSKFLIQAPSHEFHVDYHLCEKWGIEVEEMATQESDLAKKVVVELGSLSANHVICQVIRAGRMPFSRFYPHNQD